VAEATKAADERKAAIAARQAEADALAKELDALQGVAP
jgi:F0F1-type ATP synthase membrane subunit b/b'